MVRGGAEAAVGGAAALLGPVAGALGGVGRGGKGQAGRGDSFPVFVKRGRFDLLGVVVRKMEVTGEKG